MKAVKDLANCTNVQGQQSLTCSLLIKAVMSWPSLDQYRDQTRFSCINVRQVQREVLITEAEAELFNTFKGT